MTFIENLTYPIPIDENIFMVHRSDWQFYPVAWLRDSATAQKHVSA